ncbi:MAG TPA: AMP-dependent synthetase/ligase [Solirubrobacteraceae bacterium]|nr:AMP-dependent synthetase/ligase [Solirubrobacteraceae bacterium]
MIEGTGARTIAELTPRAAERYGARTAVLCKRDGAWQEHTYAELAGIVQEIAQGLISLGVDTGERLSILSGTRPEWSYVDLAATSAGIIVVPIYQTNSPEECHWVLHDSGAAAVVCENAQQLAKIEAVRDRLPSLRLIIVIDEPIGGLAAPSANGHANGDGEAPLLLSLSELRLRGRSAGNAAELERRRSAVTPDDVFTYIYTSGTTGPPKGCILTHGNYRAMIDLVEGVADQRGVSEDELVYLYLPLAHSYALLVQLASFDMGHTLAYFGGDTKQIVAELAEVRPTYLPSVPRVFEKIYTLVSGTLDAETIAEATRIGMAVRSAQIAGQPLADDLKARYAEYDERIFKNVRAVFGGRLREAVSGAAPIAKEILEFFFAAGVPVLEGYGMTETSTAATYSTVSDYRFGSIGKPYPGVQIKVAADGELLIKGPNVFQGYHNNSEQSFGTIVDGWLHTGDLGRIDEDGFVYIVGRKKDLIITAGGKNITPANLENEMKQSRWISQAVMFGDRRPYPVMLITLDEEEVIPWAQSQGLPTTMGELSNDPKVRELIQAELDRVNSHYAQVEQVKRFAILDHDFTQEAGELTPSLKVKRNVVSDHYADLIEQIYSGPYPPGGQPVAAASD